MLDPNMKTFNNHINYKWTKHSIKGGDYKSRSKK